MDFLGNVNVFHGRALLGSLEVPVPEHSHDESHIRYMGLELPISRLVVNQASALTAGGSLTNGFAPTTTLGCGSWGGNSISENLDYKHLMNVSRIGKVITGRKVPTDAEIWG
jgi:succinate-semialdehyde dehydrogenase